MKRDAKELLSKLEKVMGEVDDGRSDLEGFMKKGTDGAYEHLKSLSKYADDLEYPMAGTFQDLQASAEVERKLKERILDTMEQVKVALEVMDEIHRWAAVAIARGVGKGGVGESVDVEFGK